MLISSPLSPTLQNRNVVLVDLGRNKLELGRVFAIVMRDLIVIKRLDMSKPGILLLISDSYLFSTVEIPLEEIPIIGEVVLVRAHMSLGEYQL